MLVECKNCGAPLDVRPGYKFVQCSYCDRVQWLPKLTTLSAQTPAAWQPPPQWVPPPSAPAPSSRPLTHHRVPKTPRIVLIPLLFVVLNGLGGLGTIAFWAIVVIAHDSDPPPRTASPASPSPPPPPPIWLTTVRPTLVDVDGDGASELLAVREAERAAHVVAIDGSTGQPRWTAPSSVLPDSLYVFGTSLVELTPTHTVRALDLRSGQELWTRALGEPIAHACSDQGAIWFFTQSSVAVHFTREGVPLRTERVPEGCQRVEPLGYERPDWGDMPAPWRFDDVPTHHHGGLVGHHGWVRARRTRLALLQATGEMVRATPWLVLWEEDLLRWESAIPADPLQGEPRLPLVLHGDASSVHVLYAAIPASGASARLTSFDLTTGARRFDVPVGRPTDAWSSPRVIGNGRVLFVVHDAGIHVFRHPDGTLLAALDAG